MQMAGKRILVVDDDSTILQMERMYLEHAGYAVDTVISAAEALEKIEKEDYALIVSDIMMPKMDGFELVRLIKEEYKKSMPILLVTAMDRVMSKEKTKAAAILKKPFTRKSLLTAVSMLIGSSGAVAKKTTTSPRPSIRPTNPPQNVGQKAENKPPPAKVGWIKRLFSK
ncbi:MAG: response regulator [Proteobacteria bacterium]|nr:response regulator [Pseudomonadota bacterium]